MAVTGRKHLTRCGKCCHYCRQVTTFLFSHIGLCTLLIGYALIGAFTFQALELKNEEKQRLEMLRVRDQMIEQLWNITQSSPVLRQNEWTTEAKTKLEHFEKNLLEAVRKKGFDVNSCLEGSDELNKKSSQWSFSGSLLYSIIVITTIGYGNVAPRTDWGKIVTIIYAIIGIPLTFFCLSNIGHVMAHSFKFIYWKCCCYLCVAPKRNQKPAQKRKSFRRRRLKVSENFEMRSMTTQNRRSHLYSSHNDHTNWRRNRLSAEHDSTPIICNKYALNDEIMESTSRFPGPPPTPSPTSNHPPSFQSLMNSTIPQPILQPPHQTPQPIPKHMNSVRFFSDSTSQSTPLEPTVMTTQHMLRNMTETERNSSDETEDTDEESDTTAKNIPITICIALLISYICGGAWFFSKSEKWTFLDASYFCFITLSTIGFGDLVPGRTVLTTEEDGQVTLAICALYLCFGMALVAMSLNLLKEKFTSSVKSIGQRIGILVSDDDDD